MNKPIDNGHDSLQLGNRNKIGIIDAEPDNIMNIPDGLTPAQKQLRQDAIKQFKSNKVKRYISAQIKYINMSQQIGESIQYFFDMHGKAPKNLSIEDIIEERKRNEHRIRWLEAICSEIRRTHGFIKDLEKDAFDLLNYNKSQK